MKELFVGAAVENIRLVTQFVDDVLKEHGCPASVQRQIDVAVDEIFGNIAQYAYTPGTGTVRVRAEVTGNPPTAVIAFVDCGVPYNPLSQPAPDVHAPLEERQAGGLGIFLVKKTMDEMTYAYEDGQNCLTIRKVLV